MSSKEIIRLRERAIAGGGVSLYLDIYRGGKREYEFLKLYLLPETSKANKEKNKQTRQVAEAIRAKRTVQLMNDEYGFRARTAKNVLLLARGQSPMCKTMAQICGCSVKTLRDGRFI